jgi:hypothetical protein
MTENAYEPGHLQTLGPDIEVVKIAGNHYYPKICWIAGVLSARLSLSQK